jgi:hypothetical protein
MQAEMILEGINILAFALLVLLFVSFFVAEASERCECGGRIEWNEYDKNQCTACGKEHK